MIIIDLNKANKRL